ncbi:MAG: hypothetical protein KGZ39_02940 [Simkania sp.]|nr:hypothetical protein [Simkania sp.]
MLKRLSRLFSVKKRSRTINLYPRGDLYDLKQIYDKLNERYFCNQVDLHITWFGNKKFRPRSRIRLGSYHPQHRMIKVHRVLDQAHVPEYAVSFVVYHEMLHHVLPPIQKKKGRRHIHHREFLVREKQFQEYTLAKEFRVVLKTILFK